jgi:hypothetical protein
MQTIPNTFEQIETEIVTETLEIELFYTLPYEKSSSNGKCEGKCD